MQPGPAPRDDARSLAALPEPRGKERKGPRARARCRRACSAARWHAQASPSVVVGRSRAAGAEILELMCPSKRYAFPLQEHGEANFEDGHASSSTHARRSVARTAVRSRARLGEKWSRRDYLGWHAERTCPDVARPCMLWCPGWRQGLTPERRTRSAPGSPSVVRPRRARPAGTLGTLLKLQDRAVCEWWVFVPRIRAREKDLWRRGARVPGRTWRVARDA